MDIASYGSLNRWALDFDEKLSATHTHEVHSRDDLRTLAPRSAGADPYEPVFVNGGAGTRAAVELLAMQAVRLWLHMTPDEDTLVLAPPVLEEFQGARVQRRSLLDCGVSSWPLPLPDGL